MARDDGMAQVQRLVLLSVLDGARPSGALEWVSPVATAVTQATVGAGHWAAGRRRRALAAWAGTAGFGLVAWGLGAEAPARAEAEKNIEQQKDLLRKLGTQVPAAAGMQTRLSQRSLSALDALGPSVRMVFGARSGLRRPRRLTVPAIAGEAPAVMFYALRAARAVQRRRPRIAAGSALVVAGSVARLRAASAARACQILGSVAVPVVAGCADASRLVMIDVAELVGIVFSGLSALVIEDAGDAGDVIVVRAGTRGEPVACPGCGTETSRVHGYHERTPADVPVDGRRVVVKVRARRLRCPVLGCAVQTFREQVPGVLERYQRRTERLNGQVSAAVRELAGRAGARLLAVLGTGLSRHTALRTLLRIALPDLEVPRVLGIDDFALRRGLVYATVLTGAETGRRAGVLEGRTADVVEEWLRAHPGVGVVTRDGSGAYGEAARSALPEAVQVSDRWHLWHGLAGAAWKDVAAHSACRAGAGGDPAAGGQARRDHPRALAAGPRPARQGAGLADCARRLGLAVNTVKRYDRAEAPGKLRRAARYRPAMAGPYRGYLRKRRAEEPGAPVQQLLREIRELGYPGSSNLLVRYLNQGRADAPRSHLSPRKAVQLLLSKPENLTDGQRETAKRLSSACPEMTALASLIRSFAAMLDPGPADEAGLKQWIAGARAAGLPNLRSFTRGLDVDISAATAALTLPHHNGRTEGVNTKTKMIKRQMYGRAGFNLLRHRILLG